MSKVVQVKRYSNKDIAAAAGIKREDYKAVKHMDRVQLAYYLGRIYRRGYEAGYKAGKDGTIAAPDEPATETTEG